MLRQSRRIAQARWSRPGFAYSWGGLMAVCGWAGMEEWSGPQAEARMQDLQWLTPKIMRHEAIVESVMRVSPVLPARLGALFSSLQALERFFAIHHAAIESFLDEVENKDEWAVKGVLDRARLSQWLASHMNGAQQACAPGGAGYLCQRQARAAAGREVNRWMTQTLEPILNQLRRCAAGSYQRGPGAPAAAGNPQPIFNLAFLVARENLAEFHHCVERATQEHRAHGLELGLSGPWPPYSFCPTLEMPP
ncbi:MAG TPA: GvpL/GvpF family gas vesicle protein [Candidatus Binataceae bacterium]|nr:GvpL/GvpF family gas vesicle protein [Candidatus Binataceae bacterium]